MRIGFEAKRVFHNNTGLGNYGRDVIRILKDYTSIETFLLYNTKPSTIKRIDTSGRIKVKYPESTLWKKLSAIWRLGPVINQIKKDNINLYHGLSGELPAGLKKNHIPTVVTIHDLIFLSHPQYYSFFDKIIHKKKFSHAAKNATKVIAISEQTKRDIVKYLKIDERKIEVVYQGCNDAFKQTYTNIEKEEVKKKYQLPQEYILNVGTIEERKNALTIVKAIKDTPYHLILIGGEKEYAKKIHAYIETNNLKTQVRFLKNISTKELAIIYQLATVFCYPSLCEGFGIPIIEALFSKTPVITSRGNCFPEAAGPNSIFIESKDNKALKIELEKLFSDAELRNNISEEGYKYAHRFSDENVAKNLFNVYKSIVK